MTLLLTNQSIKELKVEAHVRPGKATHWTLSLIDPLMDSWEEEYCRHFYVGCPISDIRWAHFLYHITMQQGNCFTNHTDYTLTLSYGFTSHLTQNRSFRRHSSQSISRHSTEETKPNPEASDSKNKLITMDKYRALCTTISLIGT